MKGVPRLLVCALTLALAGAVSGSLLRAQADPDTQIVPLSDPSRPAKVEAELLSGAITVRGENRRDVAVVMRQRAEKPSTAATPPPASAGLRRLTQLAGFEVTEERNEIKIESTSLRRGGSLEVRVPLRTNLELSTVNDGTITVENVEGEIEVENVNGPVVMTGVAGSVVANSVNGGVTARLTRVMADKAMAFTSLNGPVDVTLPATIKANLKMRSDQGEIFTDFDVQMLPAPAPSANAGTRRGGRYRVEVNRAIYGAVNGGGPEIELRTFNGSVFLRKGAQ
jgi:DUF4097 and DUF4098 domain-containing protein YvlB